MREIKYFYVQTLSYKQLLQTKGVLQRNVYNSPALRGPLLCPSNKDLSRNRIKYKIDEYTRLLENFKLVSRSDSCTKQKKDKISKMNKYNRVQIYYFYYLSINIL